MASLRTPTTSDPFVRRSPCYSGPVLWPGCDVRDFNALLAPAIDVEIGDELVVESKKSAKGRGTTPMSKRSQMEAERQIPASRPFNSMSQLVKSIIQTWEAERIFRSTTYPSNRDPSVEYTTTIYWGGTMTNPNITCTCPTSTFRRKRCHHAEEMWNVQPIHEE